MKHELIYQVSNRSTKEINGIQSLTTNADLYRTNAYREVDKKARVQNGQYFTPPTIAKMMASFFDELPSEIRLLDAGAGIGTLSAAFVETVLKNPNPPQLITITAFEQEKKFLPFLRKTLNSCKEICQSQEIKFTFKIKSDDFIDAAASIIRPRLFENSDTRFNLAILNPPYKKIHSKSTHRHLLRQAGIETVNLYTAFLALTIGLLEPNGEMVAITPRSFCNGPYYKPFRQIFDEQMAFKRIHLFESRNKAFAQDDVLQENIIFHAVKGKEKQAVTITSSNNPIDEINISRSVAYHRVLNPQDPHRFIHITASELDQNIADRIELFPCTLTDLGINVSTGRVVDFRTKQFLLKQPTKQSVPLIYPHHMHKGFIKWPHPTNSKPNAFIHNQESSRWLLPAGYYTIVRRFSSKEEYHRINAAVCEPENLPGSAIAFENHINVFHAWNRGLSPDLAKGLAIYLNSNLLDLYFRQFNGHTQVNATDLRSLLYPKRDTLVEWGNTYSNQFPDQNTIDLLVERELKKMTDIDKPDPISAKQKVNEAIEILTSLGLPQAQQNERSAMTFLALLGLSPDKSWQQANSPLMGITLMMEFIRDHYGVNYAPNTRETIRRHSIHQFVQAALVVENPDQPSRPKNSPNWCYQIDPTTLSLLHSFGTIAWEENLNNYLDTITTLKERYAQERAIIQIPVRISDDLEITLSPGEHSHLMKQIIEAFAPRFAPGSQLIYVGDTGDKWGYFDAKLLTSLGVTVNHHGKMPDVIFYYHEKDWILLIEAVTSHGPVNPKRRIELQVLFEPVKDKLVYVTAFSKMTEMSRHLSNISWATEVWVSENPTHLIHFDGLRFLGPYPDNL